MVSNGTRTGDLSASRLPRPLRPNVGFGNDKNKTYHNILLISIIHAFLYVLWRFVFLPKFCDSTKWYVSQSPFKK